MKYADDLETALVANTNLGGDNCHRGAVLGALLGLVALVFAVRAWTARQGSTGARLAYTLLAMLMLTFTWQLWVWHLLGPGV